jgi:adenosylhomocysteine nucleosidase
MKILIAASDPMEFAGLAAHAGALSKCVPSWPGAKWARSARLGQYDLLLVASGTGSRAVAAAIDAVFGDFHPDILISAGYCGAVAPELGLAEIVVATEVVDEQACFAVAPLATSANHKRGVVRTIDHIAPSAEEKRRWFATGALAVEMEAAAVAARAQAYGLPFYCIKAVSDLADETLTIDLNAALRPDGHLDTINILGSTLRHPVARVPELFRLRSRAVRAANSLGDFFANCRF